MHRMPLTRHAFTLVELLIVITILGILAAIVVPRFTSASVQTKENAMKEDLRRVRTQIELFKAQHNGLNPGEFFPSGPAPSGGEFTMIFTRYTDVNGFASMVKSEDYRFGPYLPSFPTNPMNGLSDVRVGAFDGESFDGLTGWLYDPATGRFAPNLVGEDSSGKRFRDY